METLFWASIGLHPEMLASHRGHPSDSICWDYNAPDAIPGVIGGCRFSPSTAESNLVGPINYAERIVSGWGLEHKKAMRETFGRALAVGAIGEFLPNKNSYVDLDPDNKDELGLALPRLHVSHGDEEIKRLKFMAETSRKALKAAGVIEILEEFSSWDMFNATHVFGTCRMGDDPSTSVVNQWGKSHRWRNLYITDASVFPSSGGGEAPSLTIQALAIRTADRIMGKV